MVRGGRASGAVAVGGGGRGYSEEADNDRQPTKGANRKHAVAHRLTSRVYACAERTRVTPPVLLNC
jgi:hypothetical protein